jgi:2',3'-cyclic-nucleotide 2'-phosphodiesterase (5'-nucleotidase family)
MKNLAAKKDVELFVVDSGDMHDGTSLGDNTGDKVNGYYTMPIVKKLDYDLLS